MEDQFTMSDKSVAPAAREHPDPSHLYLDLLKDILINNIYGRFEYIELLHNTSSRKRALGRILLFIIRAFKLLRRDEAVAGYPLISKPFDYDLRQRGYDWPAYAYTMVGRKRLDHLQDCLDTIKKEDISGDLVETGVWRGGVCIFMAGYLKVYGITNRTIWALDSFEGLPRPKPEEFPADKNDMHYKHKELQVSLESVRQNFQIFGLLNEKVKFVKGFFSDTAPKVPVHNIAILRLDGDMYESTMVVLKSLYSKVARGGFVIVDDYALKNCKMAIDDFMRENEINEQVSLVDQYSAFWRKTH
jgi:O-methyltransferase